MNYPILANSNKYIWGSVFLVVLLMLTVIGNIILIPRIGMLGPAIAGCLASIVYNGLKFAFIRKNFGMQPFDMATLKQITLIVLLLVVGSLVPIPGPPVLAMVVRMFVLTTVYVSVSILWRTSTDLYRHLPEGWSKRFSFLR